MADPLSVTASIATLLQLSTTVVKYLGDVKHPQDDPKKLMTEVIGVIGLLSALQEFLRSGEIWLATAQSLNEPNGPLEELRSALGLLEKRLAPVMGLKKARKVLVWPFQKSEVKDILYMIERQRALLGLALQSDRLPARATKGGIAEVRSDVQELQESQKYQERRNIIAWLSTLNFYTCQSDIFKRREEKTGEWLLETDKFKKWLDGTERILYCSGLPGVGKTILTSIVVDYLERFFERKNVAIAYIYCNYKEQTEQTAVSLIASLVQQLVHQLVQKGSSIPDELSLLYINHIKTQTRPTLAEYSGLLQSEVCRFSKVFIIVDALDECSEGNGTRDSFLSEIRKLQSNVHLLVTSRHIATIEHEFGKAAHVEIRASDEDIRRYLKGRIERERRLVRRIKADPALQETIINTIANMSQGMFLLAQLHMDSLAKRMNFRSVRKALEHLPKELDDIYAEAMQRIGTQDEEDVQLAEGVLSWMSFALRPLTVRELQHALAVEPGATDTDEESLPDEDILVSVCAGLVTVDPESNIIRFVHYTTQEYFERIRMVRFPSARENIATACLTYISFDAFSKGCCSNDQEMEIRMQKYPFLEYAAQHWGDHTRGDLEELFTEPALKFLTHNSKFMCSNQVMHLPESRDAGYSQRFPKHVNELQIAAFFGLVKIVLLLLVEGADVEAKDDYGETALHWVARSGHEEVVGLLLEQEGINPDSRANSSRTPLSLASENGHKAVVHLLLEFGNVDPDSKDDSGRTPLWWASRNGHETVVRLLLEREGIDPDSRANSSRTPLSLASENGHEAVVQLLLQFQNVNPDAKDDGGRTPLWWASRNGHEAIVKLLLGQKRVDPDSKDGAYCQTPLSLAARKGHEAVVRSLVEEGVDALAKDRSGRAALHLAMKNEHEAVVRLLVEKGVGIPAEDREKALHWAVRNGHEEVVRLLLENGANAMGKDGSGRTALHWAAENEHETIARLLLEQRANVAAKDEDRELAMYWAARNGHEAVMRLLLENGDPLTHTNYIEAALYEAVSSGHKAMVRLLLEKGENPAIRAKYVETALYRAASDGHEAGMRLLLEEGDPTTQAKYIETLLHLAASGGHEAVVRLLLNRGADVNAVPATGRGRTALQAALEGRYSNVVKLLVQAKDNVTLQALVREGNLALVKLLLDTSPSIDVVNARDSWKRNPLHTAVIFGHRKIAEDLITSGSNINCKDCEGTTPLHLAVQHHDTGFVKLLIEKGADKELSDARGLKPLHYAINKRKIDDIRLLLENSTSTKGVMADQWRFALKEGDADIIVLWEKRRRWRSVKTMTKDEFPNELEGDSALSSSLKRRLFLFANDSPWQRGLPNPVSVGDVTSELRIICEWCDKDQPPMLSDFIKEGTPISAHVSDTSSGKGYFRFSVAVAFPIMESVKRPGVDSETFETTDREKRIIAWTVAMRRKTRGRTVWKSRDYFSMLAYGWIPDHGIDFFGHFVHDLEQKWLSLCSSAERHLTASRQSVLSEQGKSFKLIELLLKDAQKWTELRSTLCSHVDSVKAFVLKYNENSTLYDEVRSCDEKKGTNSSGSSISDLNNAIDDFKKEVDERIGRLNETSQALIQLEFSLVSIYEARKSTSMSASMKRLSWITFVFLPATFASSLFGMNINLLKNNPDWRWYILFGGGFLVLTCVGWLIFKYSSIETWTENKVGKISWKLPWKKSQLSDVEREAVKG